MANEELQAQSRAVRDLTKEGLDIAPVDNSFPALTQGELTAAVSGKTVIDNSNNIQEDKLNHTEKEYST